MAKAATSEASRVGSGKHLEQTKRHMQRLDNRLSSLGEKSSGKKCKGMEGLIEEGQEVIEEEELEGEALDAGVKSAAEPVEHYEIAAYGCVRTHANLLGETKAVLFTGRNASERKRDR
jgi:ferritin-like metal-binding protein YciE